MKLRKSIAMTKVARTLLWCAYTLSVFLLASFTMYSAIAMTYLWTGKAFLSFLLGILYTFIITVGVVVFPVLIKGVSQELKALESKQ